MALTLAELTFCASRIGVQNWTDPATGRRGAVIVAPSSWRGRRGTMGTVVGVTRHHTGTPETFKASEDYPTYQVVKEGRAGLDNSLSAYGLGRWYGIYVFSEYLSWHAGAWNYQGITDGNGHFLGIEAEGTGARWTPFQQEFYPRLCASILMYVGEDADAMPRHADGAMPRGRKNDARNLPADFTAKVEGYLARPDTLAYGASPAPAPDTEEDVDMVRIRNKAGTVMLLTGGYAVWVPDHTSNIALDKAGIKLIQVTDAFFNALVKQANLDETASAAIMEDLADEEPATTT